MLYCCMDIRDLNGFRFYEVSGFRGIALLGGWVNRLCYAASSARSACRNSREIAVSKATSPQGNNTRKARVRREGKDTAKGMSAKQSIFTTSPGTLTLPIDELLGSGGLPEEEAAPLATEATHQVREEMRREREASGTDEERLPPPTPDEVREWERPREECRRRDGYYKPRWTSR